MTKFDDFLEIFTMQKKNFFQKSEIFSKKLKFLVVKNKIFFDRKKFFWNFCKFVGNRQNQKNIKMKSVSKININPCPKYYHNINSRGITVVWIPTIYFLTPNRDFVSFYAKRQPMIWILQCFFSSELNNFTSLCVNKMFQKVE